MNIVEACRVGDSVKNTGKECDVALGAIAMIIAINKGVTFKKSDLKTFDTWLNTKIHAAKAGVRVYPMFGQNAPIRTINNSDESDVIETLDDGAKNFIRYGFYNLNLETTSGGLCYAQALQSFNQSGYGLIIVDQTGRMLVRDNGDGTYGGIITDFMFATKPKWADFKSSYKNAFQISISPVELINNGVLFDGASSILDSMGLIDVSIDESANNVIAPVQFTNFGANADTVNIIKGASLTGGPVTKTSAESTLALLATKIASAINANTATNGGYTAYANSGTNGFVHIIAPADLVNSVINTPPTVTIVGTIAATVSNFSRATVGLTYIPVSVTTHCASTDLAALLGPPILSATNFVVKNKTTGSLVTITGVTYVPSTTGLSEIRLAGTFVQGETYIVSGSAASIWFGNLIEGYDAEGASVEIIF